MQKWRRWLSLLVVLLIPSALFWLSCTDPGLRGLAALTHLLSNGRLSIQTASGSLFGSLRLQGIHYDDGIDTVLIEDLLLTWNPARLLDKALLIQTIHATGVRVILGESGQETVLATVSLPVKLLVEQISAEKITILSGQKEIWFIRQGTLNQLDYQGVNLRFDQLSLESAEIQLQAKGQLQTINDYPLQVNLETVIQPAGYAIIAAQGTLAGPLNTLKLKAESRSPSPVQLNGQLNNLLGNTTWQARLESPEVALIQINQGWPDQRFTDVVIDGQGTFDAYTLRVHSLAGLPNLKELPELSAEIHGNDEGLQVQRLHLVHGKTSLAAKGTLAWSPAVSWQADLSGTHLDPSLFLPDWPGNFSCALHTTGQFTETKLEASFHLAELQGSLRNFPLSGKGELRLKDKQLEIPHFVLKSAGSTLRITGQANETVDFSGQLDSGNLAELWPEARGNIQAQVRLTGSSTKPEIDLQLTGSKLGLGSDGIGKLTLGTKGALARDGHLDASLNAEQLQVGGTALDRGQLHFQGSINNHTVAFDGKQADFSTGFQLQGKIKNQTWQGTLQQTHLTSIKFGNWQQRQATLLSIDPNKAVLEPLCLTASPSGSICLNGSWLQSSNNWQVHAVASSLPLTLIQSALNTPWPIEGRLNGVVDLTGQQSRILSGKLICDGAGMVIHAPLPDGNEQPIKWIKNTLSASYADNQLQVNLDNQLSDKSTVRLDMRLTNLQLPGSGLMRAPLKGTVQLHLQDLSPLNLLTEHLIQLTGTLLGQLSINGTPSAPQFSGQIELTNGQAEIPALGITLSPLLITLKGDNNKLGIQATAHSGTGYIRADSTMQVTSSESGTNTVFITGERFRAAQLPGLDLVVSPDLQVLFGKKQTEVRGTVAIPSAQITSIDFNNATAPSSDMIVVDDEQGRVSPVADANLFTSVTLVAGDDVQINAYGVKGRITGALKVIGQPHRPQVGNGTLTIRNGSFTLYGRRLKIDLGRLLFNNGPLTNPGIELHSENKSDDVTTGVRVEGFLQHPEITFYSSPSMEQSAIISHLLQNTALGGETRQDTGMIGKTMEKTGLGKMVPYLQSLKKFSMIDEIKLDTGTNYDSASLVFGSWLTPDFYVSYGKDLLKESGSFNTRYTLGKGFYFMTETGTSQSGGDIKYEFEH
ncbi:MAG: translocation/assembly module TamB domain-containing protein [Desulfobulbaceae bacterium]|nr:translocation/assembly module TamB domain-containing protein [Desulfobulbaceae bacterium]